MLQLAKLSSKGQITVPTEVRKTLHLKTSDTLAWEVQEDGKSQCGVLSLLISITSLH